MIDQIIEKFGERFFKDQGVDGPFKNPDAVYVLSYSIMMLNTDLHHPGVKHRMSCEAFTRNVKGINDGGDLPPAFLKDIFESIESNEIRLKDDNAAWFDHVTTTDELDRKLHCESVLKSMHEKIKENGKKKATWLHGNHLELVRPMFELSRWPMLATFSQFLEHSQEEKVFMTCLEGFRDSIHIACCFTMTTEKDAFITSLAKFTNLSILREMSPKRIASINVLLHVATEEADHLQETWRHVLTCISQVEKLHLIGIGAKQEAEFFVSVTPARSRSAIDTRKKLEEDREA